MDKQELGAGNGDELAGAAKLLIRCQYLAKSRAAGAVQQEIGEKSVSIDMIWGRTDFLQLI